MYNAHMAPNINICSVPATLIATQRQHKHGENAIHCRIIDARVHSFKRTQLASINRFCVYVGYLLWRVMFVAGICRMCERHCPMWSCPMTGMNGARASRFRGGLRAWSPSAMWPSSCITYSIAQKHNVYIALHRNTMNLLSHSIRRPKL